MSDHKSQFKENDRVSFTRSSSSGNSFNFRSLEGTIVELGENAAKVRLGNNRKEWIHYSRLRLASQRNELTEMLLGKEKPKEEIAP